MQMDSVQEMGLWSGERVSLTASKQQMFVIPVQLVQETSVEPEAEASNS